MKKRCKHIDITDWNTVRPWVKDCVMRHKKRYDFKKLIINHGLTKKQYEEAIRTFEYESFEPVIDNIAIDACEHIKNRNLDLPPVKMEPRRDHTTGKRRLIGKEDAMQQVYDFIAVYSCREIFDSRMTDQQMSSIPGRGPVKGIRMIRKWIMNDNQAIRWARNHGKRYASKCRYHTKLDIKQCYASADTEIFMRMLEHDCASETIIWLWRTLLESHKVDGYTGMMIGALPSQWAAQLMMSYIHRRALELTYVRRKKTYRKVSRMAMFMDDMLLLGPNRKRLREAVEELREYAKTIGFTIKDNYEIHELNEAPIDMMGYVIYRNGKVEMRERNYIHSTRMISRYNNSGRFVISQARRTSSFKGFFKNSDSQKLSNELKARNAFDYCGQLISIYDKEAKEHG